MAAIRSRFRLPPAATVAWQTIVQPAKVVTTPLHNRSPGQAQVLSGDGASSTGVLAVVTVIASGPAHRLRRERSIRPIADLEGGARERRYYM